MIIFISMSFMTMGMMTTTLVIATAVSKTVRDKEHREGGAEHVDHTNHKIKLHTTAHFKMIQCRKGVYVKILLL